jgi:hypothetical protein
LEPPVSISRQAVSTHLALVAQAWPIIGPVAPTAPIMAATQGAP